MYYLIVIKTLSTGTQDRSLNSYEDENIALRKFHEAFNVIGGGPRRITAILMNDYVTENNISTNVINNETWTLKEENPSEE